MSEPDNDTVASGFGGGYADIASNKGKSLLSSERSALSSFNKFLFCLHTTSPLAHPNKSLDKLSQEELLKMKAVFGRYPDFMLKINKNKESTALGHLSQARKLICALCPNTDIADDKWYTQLRHQTGKLFNDHHKKTNTKKSNPAQPMSSDDLSDLCHLLFMRNTVKSVQERALLVLQWQALGRVSETTQLSYDSLGWHEKYGCMSVEMNRGKVNLQHTIHCFLHAVNWLVCPLHALGKLPLHK